MFTRKLFAFFLGLMVSLGLVASSMSVAAAAPSPTPQFRVAQKAPKTQEIWQYGNEDVYNIPKKAGGNTRQQEAAIRPVLNGIRSAPKGATINISTFSITYDPIAKAISKAISGGVHVNFVTWSHTAGKWVKYLKSKLHKKGSSLVVCKGSCATSGSGDTHHAKFMTIDVVVGPGGKFVRNISVILSANLTYAAGRDSWNATRVIVGNAKIYKALNAYHVNLRKDKTIKTKKGKVYHYPAVSSGSYTLWRMPAGTNPMYDALKATSCTTSKGYGQAVKVKVKVKGKTKTKTVYRTVIQAGMFIWSKAEMRTADRLVTLKKAGCIVEAIVTGPSTNGTVKRKLKGAGIPLWSAQDKSYIHAKTLRTDGKVSGKNRHWTFNGSYNWSYSARVKNSELVIRQDSAARSQQFKNWFERLHKNKTTRRI